MDEESNLFAIEGAFDEIRRMILSNSSFGFLGTPAGITRSWIGEKAAASAIVPQRDCVTSADNASFVASVKEFSKSSGSGNPAFGGREERRKALTTRPSLSVEITSLSQFFGHYQLSY